MLEKGIKYSPSAWFNQNLFRHIRFRYRTELLSDYSFELDDDGYPYWVVSVVAPEIGYYGGPVSYTHLDVYKRQVFPRC